jgi:hypothetical protein
MRRSLAKVKRLSSPVSTMKSARARFSRSGI